MTSFWKELIAPINPRLCVLGGALNMLYALVLLTPNSAESDHVLRLLTFLMPGSGWIIGIFCLGLVILVSVIKNKFDVASHALAVNCFMWSAFTAYTAIADVGNSTWVLMLFVAIYSGFVSCNLWVNHLYKPNLT